jgi:hypothetical protein
LTLGQALAAKVRLMVWCKLCGRRTEPDLAELVSWHGAETIGQGLRCSPCGARDADFVVSGAAH